MIPAACPARFNLADYVLQHRETAPDKTALMVYGAQGQTQWTYAQLAQAVFATATGFRQQGIGPGDRVLIQLGNVVEFPIAFLALVAIDAVPMPCSNDLTARELAELVALTCPKMALCAPSTRMPAQVPQIDAAQLANWQHLPPVDPTLGDPNRAGYVLFTSGTSGQPKPVLHAHRAVYARRMMWDDWYGLTPDDRMLHAGALNWSYTLGIDTVIEVVESAQYKDRTNAYDFDMTYYRSGLSLSPGNEQMLYWGSEGIEKQGTRNWMGMNSPAAEDMIDKLVNSASQDDFLAAARALDRVLIAGRYVIPIHTRTVGRLAHDAKIKFPDHVPMYGDWIGFLPDVWWYQE